ncbi:brain mitochondrial carrier protein 1-like [Nasonia vitripennis]|uniref:Uncharacterized protein n=1 Tax=Nasonia vitripennis TaxID=7425 RepID=A0A7M7IUH8_NASVI|nr:brain mitochondrial carrier protein 1-like [Nasonia vitripennis]
MTTNKVTTNEKPLGVEFIIAGLAGIGTGLLTNPADVLKTRLQLQGELEAPSNYRKTYNGTIHAVRTIVRNEGLMALQAGLAPVLGLQIIINGVRLGSYHFAKRCGLTVNEAGDTNVLRTAALSGVAGSTAVIIGSPLYLAKVRLQAHVHEKSLQAFNARTIIKSLWQEGGFQSLYTGWNANVPRLFVGSAVQLTTFGLITDWLKTIEDFSRRPILATFVASVISGIFLVATIHPFDVMATRIYNQKTNSRGQGALYNGMLDALSKIFRTEGFSGLYKGVIPNYLRLAPYVVITQVIYEKIALVYTSFDNEDRIGEEMANSKPNAVPTSEKPPGVEFAIGALAAVGAGFFTNPIDVVKIRLQLQGELEARGSYQKIYRNTFHAAYQIARHEGIFALQSGIVTALGFQVVLNGTRLGSYNLAKRYGLTLNANGETNVVKTVLVSGIAGSVGAIIGSPLYLVKTQLQSQSARSIAVGHQHNHTGTWSAFKSLWNEDGVRGLYRGWYANIPRVFVGSATQLTAFGLFADWLRPMEVFKDKPIFMTFVASLLGGSCVAFTMQPFDVVATRLYNQGIDAKGKGVLYNGLFDALYKIFRTEGVFGLYKGVFPTWLRIAPHTVLCLVFYEKIARFYGELEK